MIHFGAGGRIKPQDLVGQHFVGDGGVVVGVLWVGDDGTFYDFVPDLRIALKGGALSVGVAARDIGRLDEPQGFGLSVDFLAGDGGFEGGLRVGSTGGHHAHHGNGYHGKNPDG